MIPKESDNDSNTIKQKIITPEGVGDVLIDHVLLGKQSNKSNRLTMWLKLSVVSLFDYYKKMSILLLIKQ